MKYKVIDNFLEPSEFISIKNAFDDPSCPWYLQNYSLQPELNIKGEPDYPQFTHVLYKANSSDKSNGWKHSGPNFIYPILEKLDILVLLRIKLNLIPPTGEIKKKPYHYDNEFLSSNGLKFIIGIFHMNTCDGFTLLEDGTEIETKENRMILIPGNMYHSGTTSSVEFRRLINFNFIGKDTDYFYQ